MAIPRRARSIVVGSDQYRWLATERDSWIDSGAMEWRELLERRRITLVVQHPSGDGQKLLAAVPICRRSLGDVEIPRDNGLVGLLTPAQETAVSPALVRRVIEYALRNGWTPATRARDFVVSADALRSLL